MCTAHGHVYVYMQASANDACLKQAMHEKQSSQFSVRETCSVVLLLYMRQAWMYVCMHV